MKNLLLKLELRRNGATATDADAMARIADSIGRNVPGLSDDAKQRIAAEIGFTAKKQFITAPRLVFASLAVLFMVLVMLAQSAKPGQILYALKRGTNQVRVIVQPGFKQPDIQERPAAQQVKVGDDSSSRTSGSTKNDDNDATGSVQQRFDDFRKSTSGSSSQTETQKSESSDSSRHGGDDGSDDSGRDRD